MLSAYSASKFAVRGFTQALAKELGQYNIQVNAYCPASSGPICGPHRRKMDLISKQAGER